eukprot:COSAG06_NODE_1843_length_8232_cov_21.062585_9_plen_58_part_00
MAARFCVGSPQYYYTTHGTFAEVRGARPRGLALCPAPEQADRRKEAKRSDSLSSFFF